MNKSITVRVCGGLGNQMFQYAFGRCLAERWDFSLNLDISDYNFCKLRKFELESFNISNYQIINLNRNPLSLGNRLNRKISKFLPAWPRSQVFERQNNFDKKIFELSPSEIYFDGYWQSPEYFKSIRNLLLKEFTPKKSLSICDLNTIKKMKSNPSVSLHIRRGDYVANLIANKIHGALPIEYYFKAINIIKDSESTFNIFVFSDDPEWAKDNLTFEQPTYFVNHNGPDRGWADIHLISQCNYHVIANSSFSWWGAWLSKHPEKKVFTPSNWFTHRKIPNDLIQENWVKI